MASREPPHEFKLYVLRGGCGHFVGEVSAVSLAATGERSHGLVDLRAETGYSGDGLWVLYRFDGLAYREVAGNDDDAAEWDPGDEAPDEIESTDP